MKDYKFTEVLNDPIDYFLLGDVLSLQTYKEQHQLSDNLAKEVTTSEHGDQIIEKGIVIPMSRVENYPYTVYFNLSGKIPELLKPENELQIRQKGYRLKVENKCISLYTWRILENFTRPHLDTLLDYYDKYNKPKIMVPNGWYTVEILGGLSSKEILIKDKENKTSIYHDKVSTYEFIIQPVDSKPEFTADINFSFEIKSDTY